MSEGKIKYKCPSCGSQSLFIDSTGGLTCGVIGCENPMAFDDSLNKKPLSESAVEELADFLIDYHIENAFAESILKHFAPKEIRLDSFNVIEYLENKRKSLAPNSGAGRFCKEILSEIKRLNGVE